MDVMFHFVDTWIGYPEKSGEYLCVTDCERLMILEYSARHRAFNVCDSHNAEKVKEFRIDSVKLWAEIPKELYMKEED